jgi:hypothetical protein
MQIVAKKIYEILKDKGVSSIYHANSVMAACSMLRNRCLLSPGTAEKLGLFQGSKISARLGSHFGIADDVFTDSTDIHKHSGGLHRRGPVLFKLDIEIIRSTVNGKVWVTKSNPAAWQANTPHELRWFSSANDLDHSFTCGNAENMILFRHCGGKLPLVNHLKRITLDDPQLRVGGDVDCYSMAYGALRLAMSYSGIEVPIERRACDETCDCSSDYLEDIAESDRMFSPYIPMGRPSNRQSVGGV